MFGKNSLFDDYCVQKMWNLFLFFPVSIDTVKEIRCGKNTDVFREMDRDDFQEDCAFSIIYSDNFETLNLVAYSPDEANIWVTGLRCLLDSDKGKRIFSRCFVRPKAGGVWTPYVHPIGEGVLLISSWVKRGSREGAWLAQESNALIGGYDLWS